MMRPMVAISQILSRISSQGASRSRAMRVIGGIVLMPAMVTSQGGMAQDEVSPARPSFEIENNMLKLPAPVVFETGSSTLKPEAEVALKHVKAYLDEKSYISLMRIEGHEAGGGDAAQAQSLSEQRARASAQWLVSHGIDCKRLLPVGFGSSKPVADNSSPEGRAQNRRISFANAELRGRAIGGMPTDGGGRVVSDWKCP